MPPCTASILKSGIKNVLIGAMDPNPKAQGGLAFLNAHGISTSLVQNRAHLEECEMLIAPFKKHVVEKRPYLTVKKAVRYEGGMIPPAGQKTFTDVDAIRFAHALRKRARGILTGVGTVLADSPLFTVREVQDFKDCPRWIAVMDQEGKTPQNWILDRKKAGFTVQTFTQISDALTWFYQVGCLEVLVEAGPSLTDSILKSDAWDELITITQARPGSGQKDQIWGIRNSKCSPESSKN
jgi:diaminohydroxyphosphoribosylaminopyrimidine deaminase/5-amino-6-(5-phosphoribosylamino)uracil reductase